MPSGSVYALYDERTPYNYRYVGQTIQTLESRLRKHVNSSARLRYWSACWIQSVISANSRVGILELERCEVELLDFFEPMWIAALREAGYRLTNTQAGGSQHRHPVGYYTHTADSRARMTAAWVERRLRPAPLGNYVPAGYPQSLPHRAGSANQAAKLTDDDVRAIRDSDDGTTVLMERYRVSRRVILLVRKRESYRNVL